MKYADEARDIWKAAVPPRGPADTVQGELLRAVEKLRDEAHRNGNVNWGRDHRLLVEFLRSILDDTAIFDDAARPSPQRSLVDLPT